MLLRLALISGLAALSLIRPATAQEPVIAAASDLQFALEEVAQAFTKQTGEQVKLSVRLFRQFRATDQAERAVPDVSVRRRRICLRSREGWFCARPGRALCARPHRHHRPARLAAQGGRIARRSQSRANRWTREQICDRQSRARALWQACRGSAAPSRIVGQRKGQTGARREHLADRAICNLGLHARRYHRLFPRLVPKGIGARFLRADPERVA